MKKLVCGLFLALTLSIQAFAQTTVPISGDITSDATWTNDNIYQLNGFCYVKDGVTLTIQPGTIVKGDKVTKGTLIVERGGKLIADGTATQPIVFTSGEAAGSRNYGDWGGIILCGKATVNLPGGEGIVEGGTNASYGGGTTPNDDDNSGILRYVRIEFPGIPFQPNQEINGLTCAGVGRGTTLDYIIVAYSGDDSYEFFGGTVNAKHLVSFRAWDDDFDTDNGFSGRLQFGVSLRDPSIADQSGSNGFESDNDGQGSTATPVTKPVFSNFSVYGPQVDAGTTINSLFKRAAHLCRNTQLNVFNSVFAGFPVGLLVDGSLAETNATNNDLQYQNNVIAGCATNLAVNSGSTFDIASWFNTSAFGNTTLTNNSDLLVADPFNLSNPDFTLQSGSPLSSGASFSNASLQGGFFENVSYKGAFGNSDWTSCWVNWDPQNTAYNGAVNYAFSTQLSPAGNQTICAGNSLTLNAPSGNYSYAWSNGGNGATISVNSGGDYFASITDNTTGCTLGSDTVSVAVSTPVATISPSNDTTICQGQSITLNANAGTAYSWSTGATTQSITLNATGLVTVTVTDANGCTATSNALQVTVENLPHANFVAQANQLSLTFTNTSTGNNTYTWDFGNGQTSTLEDVPALTYTGDGSYTISLIATNQCGSDTLEQTVYLSSSAITVSGSVTTDSTWHNSAVVLLSGFVYVKDGVTLTIEKGTVIKGEESTKATLIIERGGKLIANGTKNQPIVFTSNADPGSRNYGDWGGIILCGKAPVNLPGGEGIVEGGTNASFGGNDITDNSGVLNYVRIEFPGIPFQPNQEINGLTCAGVGNGTILNNIQVSFSGDDSYEWFGGGVNAKHLIAFRGWDDDFDTDNGYSGKLQFGVSLRDPNVADQSGSNGLESDNDGQGTAATPATNPTFSNFSIYGPQVDATTTINSLYKRAAHLRRNTQTDVFNSNFAGFPVGLLVDGSATETNATNNDLLYRNNIISGCATNLAVASGSAWDISSWFNTSGFSNSLLTTNSELMVNDPFNLTNPDFIPQTGSPLLSGSDFTNSSLQGAAIEQVNYRGAFGSEDWTDCWANWDPQNTAYSGTIFLPGAVSDFSNTTTGLTANFTNASTNGVSYLWDFGVAGTNNDISTDANPSFTYTTSGIYTVSLTAYSPCGDSTITKQISVTVGINERPVNIANARLYPNPNDGSDLYLDMTTLEKGLTEVRLLDLSGKLVNTLFSGKLSSGSHGLNFNLNGVGQGLYFVQIVSNGSVKTLKLLVK
ncbi:MAG: PKD domain-containing protein [Bacteroidia bacterium]|nr:PKD domain-containing protein [Bacteroidia bacterium]